MTIDDWRAQYHGLSAKVERLQKHEAWAQYRLAAVEAERDAARAEAEAALNASGENAKAWLNCVNDASATRTKLYAEIGLREQRIKELEAKWKREECAHCDERIGGYQNTIWCAECFEWYLRESEKEYIQQLQSDLLAAQAGEARAVEALDVFARAYRVSMLPFAPGIDEADGAHHWMPHGWPSVADFKLANSVLSDSSALAWLAKQRAEAAAEALEGIAKENGTDGGKAYYASVVYREFPDRLTMRIGVVEAGDLMMRAAALRAGAKGGVDA